ncbi:MAG: phosphodiester glycosidase family protein [Anaerotruncus sp.]|nr:phosphodiester glycosidase family protein [Anaerotruncus sp.]
MQEFGCHNAMNLDGGGSTQMAASGQIVNHPGANGITQVSNGIIVKLNNKFDSLTLGCRAASFFF